MGVDREGGQRAQGLTLGSPDFFFVAEAGYNFHRSTPSVLCTILHNTHSTHGVDTPDSYLV